MAVSEQQAPSTQRPGRRYASAFRSRDLRTLIGAFIVDGSASWAYNVVLIAYIFDRTHSTGWIAALYTVKWIVGMIVGAYAGVLADRFDRRRVLLVSALTSALVTVAIAVIVGLDAPLWLLLAASAGLSVAYSPVRPASGALIPEVVPESDLVAANAIFALLESVIGVVGPGIGGLLLLTGDPVYGILINTASFVAAAALYARLKVVSRGSAESGGNAFAQWRAGLSSLMSHRRALVLTMFLILDSAAINAATVLFPALSDHLHGGNSGYSMLLIASALGSAVVAGLANRLAESRRMAAVISVAILAECVPLYLAVVVGSLPVALILVLVSGIGMVVVDVVAFTALQRDLPRDVLGRVLATVDVAMVGSIVLASLLGSFLYEHFGLDWAMGMIGLLFPTLGLLGLPLLRGLDAEASRTRARLDSRIEILTSVDLFAGAARSVLERLATAAEERTMPAGEEIIVQGDVSNALWVVAEGDLAVNVVGPAGEKISLPDVAAPGYVGELGLMNATVRSATVMTTVECRLLRIPGEDFVAALETAKPSVALLGEMRLRVGRTATAPSWVGPSVGSDG